MIDDVFLFAMLPINAIEQQSSHWA